MPIRINLLAEAQAAEEIRRRDPVKRAILVAIAIIVGVLMWVGSRQVKIIADKAQLANLESGLNSKTNQFVQILNNKTNLDIVNHKLAALNSMAANRYLHASMLDSLQRAVATGVQLIRLHTEQSFELVPETKATVVKGKSVPGNPAGTVRHLKLVLEAKDMSENPGGDQITKYKEALACTPYFQAQSISTNDIRLKNFSAPQLDNESGRAYVLFSLECNYPDRAH